MRVGIGQAVRAALEPYVGPTVADTCLRATALSLGKTSDDLGSSDIPALELRIRQLLAPVAPKAAIDDALATIEHSLATGV